MCTVSLAISAILHSVIFSHGVNLTSLHCICSNLCPLFKKNLDFCTFNDHFVGHDLRTFQPIILNPPTFLLVECMSVRIGGWLANENDNVTHEKLLEHKTWLPMLSDVHFFAKKIHTRGTNGLLLSNSPWMPGPYYTKPIEESDIITTGSSVLQNTWVGLCASIKSPPYAFLHYSPHEDGPNSLVGHLHGLGSPSGQLLSRLPGRNNSWALGCSQPTSWGEGDQYLWLRPSLSSRSHCWGERGEPQGKAALPSPLPTLLAGWPL